MDPVEAIADSVADREDEVAATVDAAQRVDVAEVVAGSGDAATLVETVLHRALAVGLSRAGRQVSVARSAVQRETAALRDADPRTVRSVTSADVAAAKARRVT
jgi:hypothetical protein